MIEALRRDAIPGPESSQHIAVSVAVPARNEAKTLGPLLEALLNQTYPPSEIIVADGGSEDDTVAICRHYATRGVRTLELGPALPGRGRNAAIRVAREEWVALIDAGCYPEPEWLQRLVECVSEDPGLDAVFGDHLPVVKGEWDRAQALALMAPKNRQTGVHGASTASMLLRRSALDRTGGFREDLRAAEDLLFFRTLGTGAFRTACAPHALVHWQLAPGPLAVFRRLRLYSEHHLRAGQFRTWHMRVLIMDIAPLVMLMVMPVGPAIAVAATGFGCRVFLSCSRRRSNIPGASAIGLFDYARAAMLLLMADAAVWLGVARYLWARSPS